MRNLFLNAALLFTICLTAPLFAQEGELKSVLVEDDLRPLVDLENRPDAPEPAITSEPEPAANALSDFPPNDDQPNPIPRLEPIPVPQPKPQAALRAPKPVVDSRPSVSPQRVSSPAPALQRPTATMSSIGFSLTTNADVPRVRGVTVGGLAQRSGMKPGDLISAINDTPTQTPADVERLLAALNKDELDVTVIRGGRRTPIRINVPRANRRVGGRPLPIQRASTQQSQRLDSPSQVEPVPARPGPVQATPAQPNPIVSATPLVQPVQRSYARRPAQPARPLIGEGGRLIGNGRVINSVRRLFGR